MEPLEVELAALGRLPSALRTMAWSHARAAELPSLSATPNVDLDTPATVAARPVASDNIAPLEAAFGKHLVTVADLVDHARLRFKNINDDRGAVITSAGNLLPRP